MTNSHDISPDWLKKMLTDEVGVTPDAQSLQLSEEALLHFAEAHAVTPPLSLKDKILQKIQKLNEQERTKTSLTLDNLPILTAKSNWLEWREVVKDIEAPTDFEDIYLHPLEANDKRELFVAWVKELVPDEVHYDLMESFMLLEGTCECFITDEHGNSRTVKMREGDFIEMQLGETHNIQITSATPAKAILQWLKLAA